jgi:small nuclear ribonucleoprotein D3
MKQVSLPVKLLHEGEGHVVTVETLNGDLYRGQMIEAEDCMNIALQQVTMTRHDGRVSKLEHVYLRGSAIRMFVLPDMLRNAPMFKMAASKRASAQGTGIAKAGGAFR